MKRVVVLGGSGFLGKHVMHLLRERGYSAVSLSRRDGCDIMDLHGLTDRQLTIRVAHFVKNRNGARSCIDDPSDRHQPGHALRNPNVLDLQFRASDLAEARQFGFGHTGAHVHGVGIDDSEQRVTRTDIRAGDGT